jgi:hypothetical protein
MKKLSLLLVIAAFMASCDKENAADCAGTVCDQQFKMLAVSFVDKDGVGVPVSNYSAINLRTNDTVYNNSSASVNTIPGTFIVLDDGYRSKLSAKGDDIKVTGTYDKTKQTKSTIIKVANPVCGCHFEKISGDETIKFD